MVGTQEDLLFSTESKILRGREGINLLVHACRSNSLCMLVVLTLYLFLSFSSNIPLFLSFFLSTSFS